MMAKHRFSLYPLRTAFLLLAVLWTPLASAQSMLTAEQQQMLNQLPPSQRNAVLQQIGQLQQRGTLRAPTATQASDASAVTEDEAISAERDSGAVRPMRLAQGSTIVLTVQPAESDTLPSDSEFLQARRELLERLRRRNPYRLDDQGRVVLPGIDPIVLAGLTESQASLRLNAEPAMYGIDVTVTLMPLQAAGKLALRPFGYDLFARAADSGPDTYAIPVPADYVIGPGDSVRVQLFGNKNAEYELSVERDGSVQFPEIGPIVVGGNTFSEMKEVISQRVRAQLIGTQVSITMGQLRLVQVFLVGDVNEPGSYTVGALSTITSVLTAGGGIAENGSLRNIQLKRDGNNVAELDAYDLLLRGDARNDVRVQAGDVIFVPPVGNRVSILGEVKRPAIYELHGSTDVGDALSLAGGVSAAAYLPGAKLDRIEPSTGIVTIDVDLTDSGDLGKALGDGDTLRVPAGIEYSADSVTLIGNVVRPGTYEWRPDMRLTDILSSSRALKPGSDPHYVVIRREPVPNAGPVVLSANLEAAWQMRGGPVDLPLERRDTLYVFALEDGRSQYITPLVDELRLRSSLDNPLAVATVGGSVVAPGQFPLEPGMRIADLVRAGGGLAESAYPEEAELTRYFVNADGSRETSVVTLDLASAMAGSPGDNLPLQPFDYLNIRETPNWRDVEFVSVLGEVEFPGRYPIRRGETLSSVVDRAGGLTALAFIQGSVFTRDTLKEREREQLDVLASRIESDLASLSLSDPGQSEALSTGQALLQQLRNADPVGRLVIDLQNILAGRSDKDILVRNGDELRIPQRSQEVTVLGEVQYSTSHLFDQSLSRDNYIERSGGTTAKADHRRIYIVRANGEVIAQGQSRFFGRGKQVQIQPGDTIVVPLDTDRMRPLTLWTNVTQILYNLAIAATAVSRL